MENNKRHLVFIALIAIIFNFLVLTFPQYFTLLFAVGILVSAVIFFLFFKKKKLFSAALFVFIILFSIINPYRVYVNEEMRAQSIAADCGTKQIHCTASVTDCRHYQSYSIVFADVTSIDGKAIGKKLPVRIGSYTAGSIKSGDIIEFTGQPESSSDIISADFDTSSYLRSKRVFIDFPSATITSSSSGTTPFLSRIRLFCRDIIYRYTRSGYDYNAASVCYAMFAGDKDYITTDTNMSFRQSGLTHILCVSGMHLTIIMGMLYSLLSLFSLHKKAKCSIIIVLCCIYTVFTGFTLSTIRACIMCILTFTAMMTGRKTDGYTSLFFAFLIISFASPYSILDISLILSFTSCFGIITFGDTFHISAESGHIKKLLVSTADSLFANLGAVLFTMPIVCYSFGGLSHLSVISTFIVMIPCEYLLILLVLLVLLFPLSYIGFLEPILYAVGFLCNKLCSFIIFVSDFISDMKYSYTYIDKFTSAVVLAIYAVILVVLTVFISLGLKRGIIFCIIAILNLGMFLSFKSLYISMEHDSTYSVSYFRQNEQDRQLNIRLPRHGYLIVNADSTICDNKSLTEFDYNNRCNYLLLIPDKSTDTTILASSIENFDSRYGIQKIFVPENEDGKRLAFALYQHGIDCYYMSEKTHFGDTVIEFENDGFTKLTLSDGKTQTCIVFSSEYNKNYFDDECDISAFFTRKTKNQFDIQTDEMPECDVFYTRMGRNDSADDIVNTIYQKSFYIKE